ncbi:MAG: hypothetical protein B6245_13415 [Desulfobacteraceae bacterium 4572_88]|nr:MAG: hypothetical protein B6245_13415 [Desulfobacteraceae bacterium 4572_88]
MLTRHFINPSSLPGSRKAAGLASPTGGNWFQRYVAEGSEGLNSFSYKARRPGPNINQIHQVIIWVTYHNPENTREIREYADVGFGITVQDKKW